MEQVFLGKGKLCLPQACVRFEHMELAVDVAYTRKLERSGKSIYGTRAIHPARTHATCFFWLAWVVMWILPPHVGHITDKYVYSTISLLHFQVDFERSSPGWCAATWTPSSRAAA